MVFEIRLRWENNNLLKLIEELENLLFICFDNFRVWLFLGINGGIILIGSLFSMVGGGFVGLVYYII